MYLLHETSLRHALNIVADREISSITPPHPAEFIRFQQTPTGANINEIIFHPKFTQIGGFKGRGVILIFEWMGDETEELPEVLKDELEPNKLYDINTTGYWHSRIKVTTDPLLIIRNAIIRGDSLNRIPADRNSDIQPFEYYKSSYKLFVRNIGVNQAITCTARHPQYDRLIIQPDGTMDKFLDIFQNKSKIALDSYISPIL